MAAAAIISAAQNVIARILIESLQNLVIVISHLVVDHLLKGDLEYDATAAETGVFAGAVDAGRARVEQEAACGRSAIEGTLERIQPAFRAVRGQFVNRSRSAVATAAESCSVQIACGIPNYARHGISTVRASGEAVQR